MMIINEGCKRTRLDCVVLLFLFVLGAAIMI
jgi:hypothetical protein